jgi:hypothetical protein
MNDIQKTVFKAMQDRESKSYPAKLAYLMRAIDLLQEDIANLYIQEHVALDTRNITLADQLQALQDLKWKKVYEFEVRIFEALRWITPTSGEHHE